MLDLIVSNGVAYVWTAEDWYKLRTIHRIVGVLDGAQTESEHLSKTRSLPLKLSKVETQFLIQSGIARTVEAPKLKDSSAAVDQETFLNMKKRRVEEQLVEFKKKRRAELELMVDKIIEGKRKKGKAILPDRNAVIQDEMDKIKTLPNEMCQVDLVDLWTKEEDYIPYDFPKPTSPLEILRLRVFFDFTAVRNYTLTSGTKFGGDFLAYPGDPVNYHSEFIIICQEKGRIIPEISLRSQKRLTGTVGKTLLIATINESTDTLEYKQL